MSFFNGQVARQLTPSDCHYKPMWLYDGNDVFDKSATGNSELDKMVKFNEFTGRCFACLGKGANLAFGHGGPGEFFNRVISRDENHLISEYETGVMAKIQYHPHFYHLYGHKVKSIEDLNNIVLPDAEDPARYEGFAEDVKYLKSKGEYVVGSLNGFFSGIHYFFMDYQQTLMALLTEPELINAILEILGNWNLIAANQMIKVGVDCIAICDDLGSKENLLMSPIQYRQFFKGWYKKLCSLAHNHNCQVHLHSHGAITSLLDDLVECGFDFINPFDISEGFDLEYILQKYSGKFVLVGGLPVDFWDLQEDIQKVHLTRLTELANHYGHLIIMDSGGVPEGVSKEKFERVLELSRTARKIDKCRAFV